MDLFRRKAYDQLLEWKRTSHGKSALLIEGARRVGKSTLVEAFGRQEYKGFLSIDFSIAPLEVRELFETQRGDLDTFFSYLAAYFGMALPRRESLIVFDEVQLFPTARQFVKQLVADGRYDYIETGSLISIHANVRDILIPSEEHRMQMHPLDFEEFLWAAGYEQLAALIRQSRNREEPLPDALHRKASQLMREYLLVGGMPQAVAQYLDGKDFSRVDEVKRDILDLYADDVSKYAGSDAPRVRRLLEMIPSQLSKHEKKFTFAAAKEGTGSAYWQNSFAWLDDARVANLCLRANDPSAAPALSADDTAFKCYLADTGLLVTQAFRTNALTSERTYRAVLFNQLDLNEGMLTENYVAQQLRSSGDALFYYSSYDRHDSSLNMEIDFLIVRPYANADGKPRVCPVEVKSGKRYSTVSLDKFRTRFRQRVGEEYVLAPRPLSREGQRLTLPLYMAFCL